MGAGDISTHNVGLCQEEMSALTIWEKEVGDISTMWKIVSDIY
jgi:hypothetical protein